MRHLSSLFPCLLVLCAIFVSLPAFIGAQEVEDEREFDYIEGSEKGPSHWGEIKPEWAACKNGSMQSPIDLTSERVKVTPALGELKTSYMPSKATLMNRGHDIALRWDDNAGSIKINGTDFHLQQCHWHSPSEHTINGRRYDLELHMVHATKDPKMQYNIAVVGLLYELGRPDCFIGKIENYIRKMTDQEQEKEIGTVHPLDIKMLGRNYYRYIGSLTVPPCTEGVIWTIKTKIMTVSKQQVKILRDAVHDYAEKNARPEQLLNRRDIYLYDSKSRKT